jgi:hypothetical protein
MITIYILYNSEPKIPKESKRNEWVMVGQAQRQAELKNEQQRIQFNLARRTVLTRRTQLQSAHKECVDLLSNGRIKSAIKYYDSLKEQHQAMNGAIRTLKKIDENMQTAILEE